MNDGVKEVRAEVSRALRNVAKNIRKEADGMEGQGSYVDAAIVAMRYVANAMHEEAVRIEKENEMQ